MGADPFARMGPPARERLVGLSVAEGFAGFENVVLPSADRGGQLRLVAPWHEEPGEWPDVAQSPDITPVAVPSADRRPAATALHEVLREWRAIARELEQIPSASLDRALLQAQADVLRAVHHRLFAELRRG